MPSWQRNASIGTWLLATALLFSAAPSHAAKMLDFELVGAEAAETDASFMRPEDGSIGFYNTGTVLSLELPTNLLGQLIDGPVTLSSIAVPNAINEPIQGIYFELNTVPSSVVGSLTVNGNDGELSFPSFQIGFRRGTTSGNAQQGTLDFALISGSTNVSNCAGRGAPPGQTFSGTHIDVASIDAGLPSQVSLIGVQCPYGPTGNESLYDNVFRLSLQGTIPEPSTGLLLGFGLTALGVSSRRRS